MLFLYEVLCLLHYSHKDYQLRNSADVLIKNIFNNINPSINIFITFILIGLFLWLVYGNYKILFKNGINLSYLLLMVIESIFWSLLIHFKKARHLSEIHLQKNKRRVDKFSSTKTYK